MQSNKSFPLVCIFCFVFGTWGLHRFYVGKFVTGILMALTLGGLGVWTLIDFIRIVTGNFKDNQGNVIRQSERTPADQSPPTGNSIPSGSSTTSETSTQGKTNGVTKSKPAQYAAIGCLVVVIAAVALIVTCVVAVMGGSESSDADKAEEKRKGFHCLSPYDGNHDGLERLIKARLLDPDSMQTIGTRLTPVDANGNHRVFLEYRARNALGGMWVQEAKGSMDNETCEATLLSID
jgi:TM2 domain-containing membrane protein YozV